MFNYLLCFFIDPAARNIKAITKNIKGSKSKNHARPEYPDSHNLLSSSVQKITKRPLNANTAGVLDTIQLSPPKQNSFFLPRF